MVGLNKLPESSSADLEVSESKAWGNGRNKRLRCGWVGISGLWIKSQAVFFGSKLRVQVQFERLHLSKVPLLSCGPRFFLSDPGKQPSSGFGQIYNMKSWWNKTIFWMCFYCHSVHLHSVHCHFLETSNPFPRALSKMYRQLHAIEY